MTEKKGGLFRAFNGFIEKRLDGKGIVIAHHGRGHANLKDAMMDAIEVEGWVERDGEPAHVESKTVVKLS